MREARARREWPAHRSARTTNLHPNKFNSNQEVTRTMKPETSLQLRSLITTSGELELRLARVAVADPAADEVVVRIEATPINPSDLGVLLGAADLNAATEEGSAENPVVKAPVTPAAMRALAPRVGNALLVGNEGAGTVIHAGSSAEAQALIGKKVGIYGGAMYAHYRTINVASCFLLPDDATAADGASTFINPITALGMIETMRSEGHVALVHTAAASNLGQMLNKICIKDGIGLVNIVRSQEQGNLLKSIGAKRICDSTSPTFFKELTDAIYATKATIAFDAIGGGKLASTILTCMELGANKDKNEYSNYGTSVYKQVYIYGALDLGPTELRRSFGMTWGVGGWLLDNFLVKIGPSGLARLRDRVRAELKTTFASHYTRTISLQEALTLDNLKVYSRNKTGEKFLIDPHKTN